VDGEERDNNAPTARLLHRDARFGEKSARPGPPLRRAGAALRQIRKSLNLTGKIGFFD
jgi:hypothetical protein